MPQQIRSSARRAATTTTTTEEAPPIKPSTSRLDPEALDALVAEIDAVLEQNAEEFVREYVQKGGQ